MTARQTVAAGLRSAAAEVDAAIAGLSDEQASRPGSDGSWSVKDHLTHLTVWHEFRYFEINRIGRGGRGIVPNFDDVDAFNEVFALTRRHLPLPQVIADLEFTREQVQRAIVECPEERLDSKYYLEASPSGGIAHEREHAEHIANIREREGM